MLESIEIEKTQIPLNILLVDDDEIDIMGVKRELERSPFFSSLTVANNGLEALEILHNGSIKEPFLIMLDLNMPKMGGLEFLKKLRADSKLRQSVIFVFTTSNDNTDKAIAYTFNIAGYVIKDRKSDGFFDIVDLLSKYCRVVQLPEGRL